MKKIITFLLLLPMISFCQEDSLWMKDYKLDSSGIIHIGSVGTFDTVWYNDKCDTAKCLLFLCDTSVIYGRGAHYMPYSNTPDWDTIYMSYDKKTWYEYGYVVLKNGWFTKTYLDVNKKKLPKNYFVWDCKLIEQ